MIEEKRNSLERFISEQTLGPGISGYRFIDIEDETLLAKNLFTESPINYESELINIVPAGVYSTAVLFPINKSKNITFDSEENGEEDEQSPGGKENDQPSIEDEDTLHIDQMFPNAMGLTCCLEKNTKLNDIQVSIRARYYTKVDRKDDKFSKKYGVLCECNSENLSEFIKSNNLKQFNISKISENYVLQSNPVDGDELKEIRAKLKEIQELFGNRLGDKTKHFGIPVRNKHLSSLKQSCYYSIKSNFYAKDKLQEIYNLSQEIEEVESFFSHIKDMLDLQDSRKYGLWKSKTILEQIELPESIPNDFEGKLIYSYKDHDNLKEVWSSPLKDGIARLSVNLQFSKDTRRSNNNIYFKVQLLNTSTPFEQKENDSRYFSGFNEIVNQRTFFGVKVKVESSHLVPYNKQPIKIFKKDDEDLATKFVYRQFEDYGVGHGCSVKWEISTTHKSIQTTYIPVCDTPDVEPIPKRKENNDKNLLEPQPFITNTKNLEFKWLSNFSSASDKDIIEGLNEFVDHYGEWIDLKTKKYSTQNETTKRIAENQLNQCIADYRRMKENILKFLSGESNKKNLDSFRLMNGAMFMQMWHSQNTKDNKVEQLLSQSSFSSFNIDFYKNARDDFFIQGVSASWRAFQLAFIILNLDGIFQIENEQSWKSRNEYVDLVWFPTGGGKTEAYLGIIALTIINRRRLHNDKGGGTAAIMRYTLRLLTLQQFQRATLMIMGLELIRRWDLYDLGTEPIYIGLWVGNDSLPNRFEGDDGLINEFKKLAEGVNQKSRVPFNQCPWCNSKLSVSSTPVVNSDRDNTYHYNRLPLFCGNVKCSFSESPWGDDLNFQGPIPVSLCDEEIYQHPPALLFGTVDKFAQLAHKVSSDKSHRKSDSRRLFGRGNWEANKPRSGYLPPDLIIQDELHLLLGPLGSAVALFESAVDQLCTREDGTRPKIISSTATTRNTDLQIMALFDRNVDIFPKQGVECDDSFFAFYKRKFSKEQPSESRYISKRRYLGFLPTGRTQIWMQMRLASILMVHRAVFELQNLKSKHPIDFEAYSDDFKETMDYYHTLISYFNSLKEVGKTESQVQSYILKEIRRVFYRRLRPGKLMDAFYTYAINSAELTGRLSGEEVKNQLDMVEKKWCPKQRLANYINETCIFGNVPPDFLVATNMISVGIDVSRFNTIIMNSMPRNIAEYIQASSRVARNKDGLVLTVHHPFRARDVSHYEKFIEFHEKMYSYVEPISITPFTKKAVERYLGLYLATMLRHTSEFVDRDSAVNISSKTDLEIQTLVTNTIQYFEDRYIRLQRSPLLNTIKNLLTQDNLEIIKERIKNAIDEWQEFSDTNSDSSQIVFTNARQGQEQLYISIDEYQENVERESWKIPMSLRAIEPSAGLRINQK